MDRIDSKQLQNPAQLPSRTAHEKRSEWKFTSGDNAGWRWRVTHPDGSQVSSAAGFATLRECIADASQHGYVVWIPEAERRKADL
jgi:hypothetical protein